MDTLCAAAVVFVFVLFGVRYLLSEKTSTHLINQLPGPKPIPLVGNFFDEFQHRTDVIWKIVERNKKYSSIYRVWHGPIPIVYASSPDIFEKILGSSSGHLSKGYFYKFLQPWLGDGLLTSHGPKWFAHRKMLTPAFHQRVLNNYLKAFQDNSKLLMARLKGKAENGDVFDVYPLISLCTLDIICEAAMGIKVNAQSHNQSPYANSMYRVLQLTKERFLKFWLIPDFLYFATKDGRYYKEQVGILHKFTRGIIEERKAIRKARKDSLIPAEDIEIGVTKKSRAFLDLLLREAENNQAVHLSEDEIREEVDTFAFEGHETTAVAICWTLLLLGWNEEIQEKAYQEQIEIFGEGREKFPSMKDLGEMKLLERIIKETSRIYPSIPLVARILDGDTSCGEYIIPKGTTIILDIYNLHRNPEIYPDPERFDPDRFLGENTRRRHPYAYVPFSAGSRNCIDQKVVRRGVASEEPKHSTGISNVKFSTSYQAMIPGYCEVDEEHIKRKPHKSKKARVLQGNLARSRRAEDFVRGQKFAMLEEKVILSDFIRNYKVTSVQDRSDIKLVHELLLKPGQGAKVRIIPRSDAAVRRKGTRKSSGQVHRSSH